MMIIIDWSIDAGTMNFVCKAENIWVSASADLVCDL